MSDLIFDRKNILEGEKLSDKLLKQMQNEDPRSATIALAQVLVFASQAAGVSRRRLFDLIESIEITVNKLGITSVAEDAVSNLIY